MNKEIQNYNIKSIESILSQLGVQHPEYIASVLVSNGIGVKE